MGANMQADLLHRCQAVQSLAQARVRQKQAAGAVKPCALEKAAGQRRGDQVADAGSPRRTAANRDLVGIAAERRNVVLYPAQRQDLIHQAIISGGMMR